MPYFEFLEKSPFKKQNQLFMKHLFLVLSIVLIGLNTQAQMGIGTATPNAAAQLDVSSTSKGFLAPRMTKAERDLISTVTSASKGLLIYQTDNTPGFYYYDGTAWTSLATTSSSFVDLTTAQSIGGLKTFTSNDGLLATGTNGSGTASSLGTGTRMMWYPKKSAFRAGNAFGTKWDDVNIGNSSVAMGEATTASGSNSTAFGLFTTASGNSSIAMGGSSNASGNASTAIGALNNATNTYSTAIGVGNNASGNASTAIGGSNSSIGDLSTALGYGTNAQSFGEIAIGTYNTDYTPTSTSVFSATDRLFVIGNGISSVKSNALVMLKNGNTTFGGSLAVNGNGTGTSYTLPADRGTANYVLSTDGVGGTSWAAASGGGSGVDLTTAQSVGGLKTFTSNDGLFATGTNGVGTASSLGAGTRMMWYPLKSAFRAGYVNGIQWNDVNIGNYSVAMGADTKASGSYSTALGTNSFATGQSSTAMGESAIASGESSTAMGRLTTASGYTSTSMGDATTASGSTSTAMGKATTSKSFAETVIGTYNTNYTPASTSLFDAADRLFVIGNGTSGALRDALVMLKNGNTTFSGTVTGVSFTSTSDLRLKKNITPLKNIIEALMQLNPVSYEKKNSLISTDYSIKENGFIAQELQKVMPSLVVEGTDKDKLLSVNYTAIIPVLTKAIQEQQKSILEQKKENQEQKKAIQDQQNQISELKKMVELLMRK